jgi:hypothetical protein
MPDLDEYGRDRSEETAAPEAEGSTPLWESPLGFHGTVAVGLGILAICILVYRAIQFVVALFH